MQSLVQSEPKTSSYHRTERPLVSVVVINYNYGRYLKECIESVLSQDYEPIEVIVVDDGSTDDSRGVIDSYSGRLLASYQENGGVISATNHGYRRSHGSVVIFVDADDYLWPGVVAAHSQALREPGVVRSQTYLTVLHGTELSTARIPNVPTAEGDLRDLVLEKGPGAYVCSPTSGNAWARSFLDRIFPLPEKLKGIAQDSLMMDTAPLFGKTVTLERCGAAYRLHSANATCEFIGMTLQNMQKALARYEARVERLAETASSLGHSVRASDWKAANWRLLTLEYLCSRSCLSPTTQAPTFSEHLKSAFKIRGALTKQLVAAGIILGIRVAPARLALQIASRVIHLRYM
jgi:hypothetical protein